MLSDSNREIRQAADSAFAGALGKRVRISRRVGGFSRARAGGDCACTQRARALSLSLVCGCVRWSAVYGKLSRVRRPAPSRERERTCERSIYTSCNRTRRIPSTSRYICESRTKHDSLPFEFARQAIAGFLNEIKKSTVVEFGPMVGILVNQCRNKERFNRLTAITWAHAPRPGFQQIGHTRERENREPSARSRVGQRVHQVGRSLGVLSRRVCRYRGPPFEGAVLGRFSISPVSKTRELWGIQRPSRESERERLERVMFPLDAFESCLW